MKNHINTLAVASIVAASFTFGSANAEAKTRLVTNCFWPPQHFVCQEILPAWLAEIKEVTDGRVSGRILPKSVVSPPEQLSAVENGVTDVAIQFNGLIQNVVSGPLVAMNPFVSTDNAQAMSVALWETNRKFFSDEFDSAHLLSQWVISPGELFSTTDEPVNSMADLQNRRTWALPGALAFIMKDAGAAVVATPAVKANEIISRGVVDAHIGLDPQAVKAFQLMPYTKSMTRFSNNIMTGSFSLIINNDKWNEISAVDREAISKISGEKFARSAALAWEKSTAESLEHFEEKGMKVVVADPAFESELRKISDSVTQKWIDKANASGLDGQAIYDFYTQRVTELSAK